MGRIKLDGKGDNITLIAELEPHEVKAVFRSDGSEIGKNILEGDVPKILAQIEPKKLVELGKKMADNPEDSLQHRIGLDLLYSGYVIWGEDRAKYLIERDEEARKRPSGPPPIEERVIGTAEGIALSELKGVGLSVGDIDLMKDAKDRVDGQNIGYSAQNSEVRWNPDAEIREILCMRKVSPKRRKKV